jgi:hypothetical protein
VDNEKRRKRRGSEKDEKDKEEECGQGRDVEEVRKGTRRGG